MSRSAESPRIVFSRPEGSIEVLPVGAGRVQVRVNPFDDSLYVPIRSCESSLSLALIEELTQRCDCTWICDLLARFDDPTYLERVLRSQLFAYFDPSEFCGKRLLDFGCGYGASSVVLARLLPDTEVVGVELDPVRVDLAGRISASRCLDNCRFLQSPSGAALPPNIGGFDFVMMSAVYEHLLPVERRGVMPRIWSVMNPGGALFINQTPFRYFPYEHHSTGLWFINYLPDGLSLYLARNHSKLNPDGNKKLDWNGHLRGGLRGATEREILHNLTRFAKSEKATILQPLTGDRAAYWLSLTSPGRFAAAKKMIALAFRALDRLFGVIPSTNVDVVIRKETRQVVAP